MMKALQASIINGAHKIDLKDVPKPSVEKPHYILVKVMAAAVNPSDVMNSKGRTLQSSFQVLSGPGLRKVN
jgi:NADPH:quinone reductase-like Zn-dependent oxidoreductase